MKRRDVEFLSQGTICRGWLYQPDRQAAPAPAVVMAQGFTGVKEIDLPAFAERFASAGLVVLLFDYRHFGASEGEPRGQMFPQLQLEDYRNAISFLQEHPQVDPDCIGAWGTSFSGGHVLHLGAFDRRLRAVVSQMPTTSLLANVRRVHSAESFARAIERLERDRRERYRSGQVTYVPVVADGDQECVLPGRAELARLTRQGHEAPTWRNAITAESFEKILEYTPAANMRFISPTPLLMILAGLDTLTSADLAMDAYEAALEPKSLVWLRCGHHDVYDAPQYFERACGAAIAWFLQHLKPMTTQPERDAHA